MSYPYSIRVDEVESHALQQNVEEEPGVFQEASHHQRVGIGGPENGGKVAG